jgi:hypothetical protein
MIGIDRSQVACLGIAQQDALKLTLTTTAAWLRMRSEAADRPFQFSGSDLRRHGSLRRAAAR